MMMKRSVLAVSKAIASSLERMSPNVTEILLDNVELTALATVCRRMVEASKAESPRAPRWIGDLDRVSIAPRSDVVPAAVQTKVGLGAVLDRRVVSSETARGLSLREVQRQAKS